jgi:predicted TIM-barrel fold metal-dependent hydrolase
MESNGWSRREFVVAVPGMVAGISAIANGQTGGGGQAAPWSAGTEPPRLKVPPNATDCHHHIYDSRFPNAPEATLVAPNASIADYRLLQKRLGITRHVIVLPSAYGTDNSGLIYALGRFGPEEARGVAVVNTSVTDRELKDLHAAGVRGIRFNLSPPGTTTFQMITPLAKQIEPLGWHIQVNASADQIVEAKELWNRVPCPIVFDHIAHVPQPAGINHPVCALVIDLMQKGKAWLKLSGAYQETKVGAPTYSDTVPVVRAFVKAAPGRLVWGSDWPHPTEKVKPDDAILLDLLAEWVPDTATRNRILVDNPAKLYGF